MPYNPRLIVTELIVQRDPVVPGVVRISRAPDFPRPWVAVVGSIHGNEPAGLRAIERIKHEADAGQLPLERGTLVLIHGNPEASRHNRRYTDGGADLNRIFDFEFEHRLRRDQWAYEHERAIALRPIFEQVDAAIDLHSATEPTPPFVITTQIPASAELGQALGMRYVTRGWDDLNILSHRVFIALLTRREKPALAVECGQHTESGAPEIAYKVATRFLIALGVLDGEIVTQTEVQMLDVIRALRKPSSEFRFSRHIRGFEVLPQGTLIGSDSDISLSVSENRYALLPNDHVPVGVDMLYLARPASDLS